MRIKRRSTPAGEHRPVLLAEIMEALRPGAGETAVDCTVGFGGHAAELLQRVGPGGRLIGLDLDGEHLNKVSERLASVGHAFELCQSNFAGLEGVLRERGVLADVIIADLGMSSMQVDDPERGFSYSRDGALDMRMDRSRGKTVAALLASINEDELGRALAELGDEPNAAQIAGAIVAARQRGPIERTRDLARIIQEACGKTEWRLRPSAGKWDLHPAARTFQALRILVNRELANLEHLLRILPGCLREGGHAAIVSFHSGEDRLVKAAFRAGLRSGVYARIAEDAVRPSFQERQTNPRARSAKLRWAVTSDK